MVLYTLYIFNRYGDSIFYTAWARVTPQDASEFGLVGGLIFTLQQFMSNLSNSGTAQMRSIRTPSYKLHYRETMTGYRFALTTDAEFASAAAQEIIEALFQDVFVEHVVKDPGYRHEPGVKISSTGFTNALRQFLLERKLLAV